MFKSGGRIGKPRKICAVTAAALLMVDDICAVTSATAVAPAEKEGRKIMVRKTCFKEYKECGSE